MNEELAMARAREAATREILEVISHRRDDDRPVFDAVLRNAIRLCGADTAALMLGRPVDPVMRLAAWGEVSDGPYANYDAMIAEVNAIAPVMDPAVHLGARAICSGKAEHILDAADTDSYRRGEPTWLLIVDEKGTGTMLSVPLKDATGSVGAINLHRREIRLFSEDEIELVRSFAAQAVIAIENVRQFRELQTRLAREAATREILEVISQSRDDDQPVFDAILHRVADLCDADAACLILGKAGDTHQRMPAHYGIDPATIAIYDRGEVSMSPVASSAAQAIISGKVVHVEDQMDTEFYRQGVGLFVSIVRDSGIRTEMLVPLLTPTGGIGAFVIFRKEVRPFTADEIALAETFAAQAVIAIENVQQFRAIQTANAELETRLSREAATREILEVISVSRDDDVPVFDMIAQRAAQLCGASVCALWRVEDGMVHYCASCGLDSVAFADTASTPSSPLLDNTLIGQAVKTRTVARIEDATLEGYLDHEWAQERGLKQLIGVPIFARNEVWGSINLMWPADRSPQEADIQLVETFAAQASIAIENVRQFKALEALNAELGDRVQEQVGEIERMGRLKRFLPAAVADAVVSSGSEKMLSSHRALLGVLFCDIRGFTAFCETAEPEETIEVLQTYHEEMGALINAHKAGVDHRMGDGIMVLFNDPLPCDDPAGDAVRLAMAMRDRMAELCGRWKKMGHRLGFGVGVSLGYATVGMVGSGGRFDYTASGTAINLASRLADEAQDGEILLSPRARTAVEDQFPVELRGEFTLKGIREPVEVFRLTDISAA